MTPQDYEYLFSSAKLTDSPTKLSHVDHACTVMVNNSVLYRMVSIKVSIPWICIAAIHYRESSQSFNRHLHNGDSLDARTIHVPVGRPKEGSPPFSWQESAVDALANTARPEKWDLAHALEFLEQYNGPGYQRHDVNSPYLWSYTDKYTSGLYVADGTFDPVAVNKQAGCAALFKNLERMGLPLDFRI